MKLKCALPSRLGRVPWQESPASCSQAFPASPTPPSSPSGKSRRESYPCLSLLPSSLSDPLPCWQAIEAARGQTWCPPCPPFASPFNKDLKIWKMLFPKSIKSARQDWKFYLRVLQLHASVNSVARIYTGRGGSGGFFLIYISTHESVLLKLDHKSRLLTLTPAPPTFDQNLGAPKHFIGPSPPSCPE